MSRCRLRPATWVLALLVATPLGVGRLTAQDGIASDAGTAPSPPPIEEQGAPPALPAQEQPEVLNRGPVHEAFAEPVNMQLQDGLVAPEPPPPNIAEVPPEQRPQGQEFSWIPGYWSWDADRNGYIWVSACWRVAPPNMAWVPGYWSPVPEGWLWVAGFWAPANVQEIEYLPAPPTIADVEPHDPAPSPDTIWIPPCMYWVKGQYRQRAGYWLAAQPNWVWVPSHYIWTPHGHIFAEGHWDYALDRRGMLFAPISFPSSVYGRLDYTFSPSIVIDVGLLAVSLFAYPRYSHYYFGDYYDDTYLHLGIYPWFDCQRLHTWYDPIYEHNRWHNQRSKPRWEEHERDEYRRRHDNKDLRPARTYRDQESRLARLPDSQRRAFQVTQPITVAVTSRKTPLKFERINADSRQRISNQAIEVRTFRDQRTHWESTPTKPETVPPPREHRTNPTSSTERNTSVAPTVSREPTFIPPRDAQVSRPERVQIPASPVVDNARATDVFRSSLPDRPTDENRGEDSHRKSRR